MLCPRAAFAPSKRLIKEQIRGKEHNWNAQRFLRQFDGMVSVGGGGGYSVPGKT